MSDKAATTNKITREQLDIIIENKVEDFINNWSIDADQYEEELDQIYGEVEICGMKYSSGRALRELDETAFRCGMSECECPENISEEFRETLIDELSAKYEVSED